MPAAKDEFPADNPNKESFKHLLEDSKKPGDSMWEMETSAAIDSLSILLQKSTGVQKSLIYSKILLVQARVLGLGRAARRSLALLQANALFAKVARIKRSRQIPAESRSEFNRAVTLQRQARLHLANRDLELARTQGLASLRIMTKLFWSHRSILAVDYVNFQMSVAEITAVSEDWLSARIHMSEAIRYLQAAGEEYTSEPSPQILTPQGRALLYPVVSFACIGILSAISPPGFAIIPVVLAIATAASYAVVFAHLRQERHDNHN